MISANRDRVRKIVKLYLFDAFGAMALGLFASLLIGTVFNTVYERTGIEFFNTMHRFAIQGQGAAMAVAIAGALDTPRLVTFSLCCVGFGANETGGVLGVFIVTIIAQLAGKLVSKKTPLDVIVTPAITIIVGSAASLLIGPQISGFMTVLGNFIMNLSELQPFWMGLSSGAIMGMILTLPISSAAVGASLGLTGIAGGAVTAGCCAQMIGFAAMSRRENSIGGIAGQAIGSTMLQFPNVVKNPYLWIPPTVASGVSGVLSASVFKLHNDVSVSVGMGNCGLVGPIGLLTTPGVGWFELVGIILVCFVIPAVITPLIAIPLKKTGLIKPGDMKVDV